jgi:hypothetical protein
MGIIAVADGHAVYLSPTFPRRDLLNDIKRLKETSRESLTIRGRTFSIRQFDFHSRNAALCSVYLLCDSTSFYHFARTFIILIPGALILFIVLTGGSLTYFMSRRIIRPLQLLYFIL